MLCGKGVVENFPQQVDWLAEFWVLAISKVSYYLVISINKHPLTGVEQVMLWVVDTYQQPASWWHCQ